MIGLRPLPLGLALLCACGGGAPPPAPPPPPSPTAPATAPPSPAPPALSLLDDDPPAAPPPEEIPPPAPPLPYPGRFVPVPLPRGTPPLVAVTGNGARDVWMMAKGGAVLRWDGARVASRGTPACFTDSCCGRLFDCARAPAKCTAAAVARCPMGRADCAWRVAFDGLYASRGEVVATGSVDTGGLRPSFLAARARRGGGWSCERDDEDDLIHPGAQTLTVGPSSITLETPAILVNVLGRGSVVVDGRRLPLPAGARGVIDVEIAATAADDLWLYRANEGQVWQGDGISWTLRPTGIGALVGVFVGPAGSVWALGSAARFDEADRLLRWDRARGAWRVFPTPEGFAAGRVLGGAGSDFWLVGKQAAYHGDGRALRRAELPLEAAQIWLAPSGELWAVGAEKGEGAAYRMVTP